jgi:hypothetical protein
MILEKKNKLFREEESELKNVESDSLEGLARARCEAGKQASLLVATNEVQ